MSFFGQPDPKDYAALENKYWPYNRITSEYELAQAMDLPIVVISFYSVWCPHCQRLSKTATSISQKFPNLNFYFCSSEKVSNYKNIPNKRNSVIETFDAYPQTYIFQNSQAGESILGNVEPEILRDLFSKADNLRKLSNNTVVHFAALKSELGRLARRYPSAKIIHANNPRDLAVAEAQRRNQETIVTFY